MKQFTAVYKKTGGWYSGWVEEIPGANSQGRTLKETKENLQEALELVLKANRQLSSTGAKGDIVREPISIPS
jgi:predicted RNase H-like HicB family nuclease